MLNWYRRLNIDYQTMVWSIIITLSLLLVLTPLLFFSYMEIPLGILLGGTIGALIYFFFGLVNTKTKLKTSVALTISIIIIKLIVMGGILFLVGWLYYSKDLKIFNIFALAGGYLMTTIIYMILVRKEKTSALS